MPRPITVALATRRPSPISARLVIQSANPETTMAIASEPRVIAMLYDKGIGKDRASMPMKCIDQMPQPMATAPPPTHRRIDEPPTREIREESRSAVWETNTATAIDRRTSQ